LRLQKENFKGTLFANCSDPTQAVVAAKELYRAVQFLTATFGSGTVVEASTAVAVVTNSSKTVTWRAFRHGATNLSFVVLWLGDATPAEYVLHNCSSCCTRVTLSGLQLGDLGDLQMSDLRLGLRYALPSTSIHTDGNEVTVDPLPLYDSPVVLASARIWDTPNAGSEADTYAAARM
jgi:hypothetical protein